MAFSIIFDIVAGILAIADIAAGIWAITRKGKESLYLGITSISAGIVALAYVTSASTKNYYLTSASYSVLFIAIDVMIFSMLCFTTYFTEVHKTTLKTKIIAYIIGSYIIYEAITFIVNIFVPFAIDYKFREQNHGYAYYEMVMHFPYWMHLAFSYLLIVAVLALLIRKTLSVPMEYKSKYHLVIIGIVLVVLLNAIFLFINGDGLWAQVDYSVLTYSIVIFVLFFAHYEYSQKRMLNHFKSYIFENVDQGLILFDYNNEVILHNSKADSQLKNIPLDNSLKVDEFLILSGIKITENPDDDFYSVQCYIADNPLRCDYRLLKNKKNEVLGKLFVFADARLETDILTGFHSWEAFKDFSNKNKATFEKAQSVMVCDINKLALYNSIHGRDAGDKLLKSLADKIRYSFDNDTYFVRGNDSALIAISYTIDAKQMSNKAQLIQDTFDEAIQYGISSAVPSDTIIEVITRAIRSMNNKKLLDKESAHFAMISSLIRALKETDSDTEAHVKRTEKMGKDLGIRLGLSDDELSDLSLLCVLHDIGKIGVPLEILNKPGKLTDAEWKTIKSHVDKGFEIAMSSPELSSIADMIKYHHERWDGKGYPVGLSRESIPLLARIISVVDSFDAMINNRSYRKALTLEQAKAEIRNCAGTQFDPYIASEFLKLIETEDYAYLKNDISSVVPTIKLDFETNETVSYNVHPVKYAKYTLNSNMRIIAIDENFTQLTGYKNEDITARDITQFDLIPLDDRTDYSCLVNEQLAKSNIAYFEHRLVCKDKSIIYVMCMGRKYFDSVVREERSEIIVVDTLTTHSAKMTAIEREKKAEIQLREWENLYRRDSLTGLLTHSSFVNDIEDKIIKNEKIMLIMIDVDNFKEYNDTYGHKAGDECLITLAQTIASFDSSTIMSSRMGGDEFSIGVQYNDYEEAKKLATEIFDKITLNLSNSKTQVKISMGVSFAHEKTRSFDRLYEQADKALYESKNKGRSRLTFN